MSPLRDILFIRIITPGMVRARDGPGVQVFEHTIHVFALDDLGLFGLFVESSEREGIALVERWLRLRGHPGRW